MWQGGFIVSTLTGIGFKGDLIADIKLMNRKPME